MKDCKKIHPLLTLYAEDALSPKQKAAVERHLSGCPVARAEMEHGALLRRKMKDLPEPKTPHDLHERIMARVQGRSPAPARPDFRLYYLWPLAAAACAAIYLYVRNPGWLEKPQPTASAQPTQVVAMKPLARNLRFNGAVSAYKNFGAAEGLNNSLQNRQVAMVRAKRVKAESAPVPGGAAGAAGPAPATEAPRAQVMAGLPQPAVAAPAAPAALLPPSPTPTAGIPNAELADQTMLYSKEITAQSWSGPLGPVTVESQLLITDAVTFQTQWALFQPNQPLPTVDFTTQAVVLLTAGNEPTTGYSIKVSKLEEQAAQLVVHYQVVAPAPGTVTGQMVTRPWSMQAIPKPSKPVVFLKD